MTPELFINNCIFIGLPLLGLAIGAILAPFLYRRKKKLAVVLNLLGFLLYIIPTGIILCGMFFEPESSFSAASAAKFIEAALLILFIFAAVEVVTLMKLERRNAFTVFDVRRTRDQ